MNIKEFFEPILTGNLKHIQIYHPFHPVTGDEWSVDPVSECLIEHKMNWDEFMEIPGSRTFWMMFQEYSRKYDQHDGTVHRDAFTVPFEYVCGELEIE